VKQRGAAIAVRRASTIVPSAGAPRSSEPTAAALGDARSRNTAHQVVGTSGSSSLHSAACPTRQMIRMRAPAAVLGAAAGMTFAARTAAALFQTDAATAGPRFCTNFRQAAANAGAAAVLDVNCRTAKRTNSAVRGGMRSSAEASVWSDSRFRRGKPRRYSLRSKYGLSTERSTVVRQRTGVEPCPFT
jgi:hypothetical protein